MVLTMEYTPPPSNPVAEIRPSQENRAAEVPKITEKKQAQISPKYLIMMMERVSTIQDNDPDKQEKLEKIVTFVAERSGLDTSNLPNSKAESLKYLSEMQNNSAASVIPIQANNGNINFSTNINSQASRFKIESQAMSNAVLINDASGRVAGNGTIESAAHVLGTRSPDSIQSHLSKYVTMPSIDSLNPEPNTFLGNDPRFSNSEGKMDKFKGAESDRADFARIGYSVEAIRAESVKQITSPDYMPDNEIVKAISNGEVSQSVLFNGRNAVTGEYLTRPEVLNITPSSILTNSLNYDKANLDSEQTKVFQQAGGLLYFSELKVIGGSSGSQGTILLENGKAIPINHSAKFRISPEQAKVLVSNNPDLDKQSRAYLLKQTGLNIGLDEAISKKIISFEREAVSENLGKLTIGIAVLNPERNQEILAQTNKAPDLKALNLNKK